MTVNRNKFLFNKTNRRTNFPNLFLSRNSTCFLAVPLPIIRFPLYTRHWCMSYGFDDSFQARPDHQTCITYTSAECTVKHFWWWAEELPETCTVSWQNKFGKLVRLLVLLKTTQHYHITVQDKTKSYRHTFKIVNTVFVPSNLRWEDKNDVAS
jgi:hypothetical protein